MKITYNLNKQETDFSIEERPTNIQRFSSIYPRYPFTFFQSEEYALKEAKLTILKN